jgi:hypothetical protein
VEKSATLWNFFTNRHRKIKVLKPVSNGMIIIHTVETQFYEYDSSASGEVVEVLKINPEAVFSWRRLSLEESLSFKLLQYVFFNFTLDE